jgi:tetratricopeptide (TPR) repeat protein
VDNAITQAGIAKAINIRLEHVSRAVKNLDEKGFLYIRTGHVRGLLRQKKAYFLTANGIFYANDIKRQFNEKLILICTLDGELREIKFNQLNDFINIKLTPLDVFEFASKSDKNIIDLKKVIEDRRFSNIKDKINKNQFPEPAYKQEFIFSSNVPPVDTFLGREKEINTIQNALKSDAKIIIIHGLAGIGKTTLVSKIIEEFEGNTNIFWYQFEIWSSFKHVLKSIGKFLNKLGKSQLFNYFESGKGFELSEVMDILNIELDGINAIFVFDDFQRCDKHTLEFFSSLKNVCERIKIPKIIITSRSKLKFYDQRDINIKRIVTEVELSGLDRISSKKLINSEKINDNEFNKIYEILKGHPVGLKLIDPTKAINNHNDFFNFIEEEIFDVISNEEKQLLNVASIFRYPVNSDVLFINERNINYDTLSTLERKFLLMKNQMGNYTMHELLVELYNKRITPLQKKSIHLHAANYYNGENNDIFVMEQIYHLINANEFQSAADSAIEFGDRLISNGYLEFVELLDLFENSNITTESYKEISKLKGDALIRIGEWDRALGHFESQLQLLNKYDEKENIAEIYNKMGNVYGQIGNLDKTIEYNQQSLKLFKEQEKKKETAKIYNDLGINYRLKGDYDESKKMFQYSLKILKEINENEGIPILLYNLGKLYESKDGYKSALQYYYKGLKYSKKSKFDFGLALGYKFLGTYHFSNNEYQNAIKYFKKSLPFFDNSNYYNDSIQIYILMGDIYQQYEDFKKAIEMYKKGINKLEDKISKNKIFKGINPQTPIEGNNSSSQFNNFPRKSPTYYDKRVLIKLFEMIGNIHRKLNDYDSSLIYHTKQLDIAKEIDNESENAIANINIGIDYKKSKIYDQSLNFYNDALKNLHSVDDTIGIITVHRNIGRIYDLKKEPKNALSHFTKSLDLSKNIQYITGTANAYREIAKIYIKIGDKKKGNIYLKKARRLLNNNGNK